MRKTHLLLLVAVVTITNTGCTSSCGRIRSWFRRGAPCGTTTVAPTALGTPLTMNAPRQLVPRLRQTPAVVQTQPMCQQAVPSCVQCPETCIPCEPICGDTGSCSENGGWVTGSSGYFGGYVNEGDAGCASCNGGTTMEAPGVSYGNGFFDDGTPIPSNAIRVGEFPDSGVRDSGAHLPERVEPRSNSNSNSNSGSGTRRNDPGPRRGN